MYTTNTQVYIANVYIILLRSFIDNVLPIDMMIFVQDTVSIVRPQKCINPPTLTSVSTTHPNTWIMFVGIKCGNLMRK